MKKRKKWNKAIDALRLVKETKGFNGADLEAVIKETIEKVFIDGKDSIITDDLLETIKDTKSITDTMKDRLKSIEDTIKKMNIKNASKSESKGD